MTDVCQACHQWAAVQAKSMDEFHRLYSEARAMCPWEPKHGPPPLAPYRKPSKWSEADDAAMDEWLRR